MREGPPAVLGEAEVVQYLWSCGKKRSIFYFISSLSHTTEDFWHMRPNPPLQERGKGRGGAMMNTTMAAGGGTMKRAAAANNAKAEARASTTTATGRLRQRKEVE